MHLVLTSRKFIIEQLSIRKLGFISVNNDRLLFLSINSTDEDWSSRTESFCNSKFTQCFHKTKLMLMLNMQNYKQ